MMPSLTLAVYVSLLELNVTLSTDELISRVKQSKGTLQPALFLRERVPSIYRRVSASIYVVASRPFDSLRTPYDESWVYASGGVGRISKSERADLLLLSL